MSAFGPTPDIGIHPDGEERHLVGGTRPPSRGQAADGLGREGSWLVPVIEGAGGVITDWRGAPLTLGSGDRILAAGDPARHAEALEILAG